MDRPLHHLRRVLAAIANVASPGLADVVQHPGIRRLGRLFHRQKNAAHLDGKRRVDHPADWSLLRQFDSDDRSATDPYRAANSCRRATRDDGLRGMAAATAAQKHGLER